MQPDFLIIPKAVHCNANLCATDWIVYAVIYWYQHMKDGKCFASNESIGAVAQVGARAVMKALERLEAEGYIERIYDDNKARRVEIRALVVYSMPNSKKATMPKNKKEQKALVGLEAEPTETPGEFARKFFEGDKEAVGSIGQQLEDAGLNQQMVIREMIKFKNYWTEPTKNGKRQRWELQQTFDVKRRLGTWFRNIAERQGKSGTRAGAGVAV